VDAIIEKSKYFMTIYFIKSILSQSLNAQFLRIFDIDSANFYDAIIYS